MQVTPNTIAMRKREGSGTSRGSAGMYCVGILYVKPAQEVQPQVESI